MIYDVVVIGGGPSGMMAAGRAAEQGVRVLLLEKNSHLGKKLLITGGGRSNVTNAEFNRNLFLEKFQGDAKFLFSPFSQFGVEETINFFQRLGMPTKVEEEKRVFPQSNQSQSVLDALVAYLRQGKVTVQSGTQVTGFARQGNIISAVCLKNGEQIEGRSFVLATGGRSRPETGSTGEGFHWLSALGHTVIESDSALVPIAIQEPWIKKLSGLSLRDVKVTIYQNSIKQESKKGKLLFTHFGLSGPVVLNISKAVGELLKYGAVEVSLDMKPSLDAGAVDRHVQAVFQVTQNKKIKNALGALVAPLLVPVFLELLMLDPEKFVNKISRTERLRLVQLLKDFRLTVAGLLGVEKAIVTSGGVALSEVDFQTMRSRLYPNLYLVGDILNIDRPSGGYSLQLCWTTGFVAGSSAAEGKE